jgi:hypothetical protein
MEIRITNMMRDASDGLVTTVMWAATKTSGEHTASLPRATQLTRGDSFVAFESLTQQMVKDWITGALSAKETEMLELALTRRLDVMANPPARPISGTPW